MSAWGGIDFDDDMAEHSAPSVSFDFDAEAVLKKAESDPEAAKAEVQHTFIEAAQNGSDPVLQEILGNQSTAELVDINGKDEAGSTALNYASCFGHENAVAELLRSGADPNLQDANEWTALMWAANNNHLGIVKQLLAADADVSIKTSSGRTMFDLQMSPSSATYLYLTSNGYMQPNGSGTSLDDAAAGSGATGGDAFYEEAIDPAEVENQFNENLKESAAALGGFSATSDIYSSGMGSSSRMHGFDDEDEFEGGDVGDTASEAVLGAPLRNAVSDMVLDFDWETFKVKDSFAIPREMIPEFLDLVITKTTPTLQKNQTPVSANALFLATRYFYYCGTTESFTAMTSPLARRVELVVEDETHATDLAFLSYWLTNTEVYLYYLRKDKGLNSATVNDLQPIFESLILLISGKIQSATQKLLVPLIAPCLLDFDSIPEYGKVEYRDEWKLFRSGSHKEENLEDVAQKHMLPPSQETKRKKPGPQRVTSILSSLLLLFQIYGVHSVTQAQIMAKLLYFVASRIFNKVSTQRRYLNRRRAMQIRLNMSVIEDWCRNHNFRPESVEIDGKMCRYKSLIDIGRVFLAPLNQILAWLQTFSGFGSDFTNVVSTLQELKALNPKQLLQTATHYRFETRESPLSKEYKHYLQDLSRHYDRAAEEEEKKSREQQQQQQQQQKQQNDHKKQDGLQQPLRPDNSNPASASKGLSQQPSNKDTRINQSCVLVQYELPVAEEYLLDENLKLIEHIPFFEEADEFWGDADASGIAESQGARFLIPYIPAELVETVTKQMEQGDEDEVDQKNLTRDDEDQGNLKEPEMATRRPMDGEEAHDDVDNIWSTADDDGLAPVW